MYKGRLWKSWISLGWRRHSSGGSYCCLQLPNGKMFFSEANSEGYEARELKLKWKICWPHISSSQQWQPNIGTGAQRGCGIPIHRHTHAELDTALNSVPMASFELTHSVILCFSELCWPHSWEEPSITACTCNLCWKWSLWRFTRLLSYHWVGVIQKKHFRVCLILCSLAVFGNLHSGQKTGKRLSWSWSTYF